MPSIELYINHQLCEIDNPENFSVYLKRQLLNPAELSTKDAQRSYDITLPATAANNQIFGYTNIEEVKGKFSQLYDAQLLVNGVKIFDGKFKISEITQDSYKGNLGVPAQKSVKDIFGETMMNQAGEWLIPFKDQTSITEYNEKENPECFFPLVLYGLLPKEPKDKRYSDKDILDDTVVFDRNDFPPSINCLGALKQIFSNHGITLTGSAFEDERLKNLYVSYKNPSEYQMPWNYGKLGKMSVNGNWTNIKINQPFGSNNKIPEDKYLINEDIRGFYVVDLLKAKNGYCESTLDTGRNVTEKDGQTSIRIPYSGLYKITFSLDNLNLDYSDLDYTYNKEFPRIISARASHLFFNRLNQDLSLRRFEIKLLRNKHNSEEAFALDKIRFDNVFYEDNIGQKKDDIYPKHFPQANAVNFIDPKQNEYLLCGFAFARNYDNDSPVEKNGKYYNPIAISGGSSWNKDISPEKRSHSAVYSPGYLRADKNAQTGEVSYLPSDVFKVNLEHTEDWMLTYNDNFAAVGRIEQVVWLEQNEEITIVACSDAGCHYKFEAPQVKETNHGWIRQEISYTLEIEAFRESDKWLQVDEMGKSPEGTSMNWNDKTDFLYENINLIRFLPSDVRINDWVDNFCKAFNLDLIQTAADKAELRTKKNSFANANRIIDLDGKTNVTLKRHNQPLNLPAVYQVGFTVDKNEQGYKENNGESGGGRYETGSTEMTTINQTSNFSYNWFKTIEDKANSKTLSLPLISDAEIWLRKSADYEEMMKKDYINKAQRFWYKSQSDPLFPVPIEGNIKIQTAMVSDTYLGKLPMRLDYKSQMQNIDSNKIPSILDSYFILFADADNSYTTVECFLDAEEYNAIPNSLIKLNGDLYYTAEIDGYEPSGRKKTTLKLIRKFL